MLFKEVEDIKEFHPLDPLVYKGNGIYKSKKFNEYVVRCIFVDTKSNDSFVRENMLNILNVKTYDYNLYSRLKPEVIGNKLVVELRNKNKKVIKQIVDLKSNELLVGKTKNMNECLLIIYRDREK